MYMYGCYHHSVSDSGLLVDILGKETVKSGVTEPAKLGESLKSAFLDFDARMKPLCEEVGDRSGATATTVLLTPSHIICANSGDSRSVLCRGGKPYALSRDHKPDLDDERQRIVNAGGTVFMKRVNGNLAVSRALGDFPYKQNADIVRLFADNNMLFYIIH